MAYHWIPEDDFLLRKSIEHGASLECLAKGAVKFSRKFTLQEISNRWHTLLYNPQVTSMSSSSLYDVENSDQFLLQSHHNNDHNHHTTSVRSQYYSTRSKRMRLEKAINDDDDNDDVGNDVFGEDLDHVVFGEHAFNGSSSSDFFDLKFDESDFEIFRNTFPEIMNQDDDDDDGFHMVNQLLNMDDEGRDQDTTTTTSMEHVLLQEEFQDHMFQQVLTIFNETPSHTHDHQETWTTLEANQDLSSKKEEEYCHKAMSLSELDPHPEIKNGVLICVLNQESEIPDNDDIDLQYHKPKSRNSVSNPLSSSKRHMKPPLPPMMRGSSQDNCNNNMIQGFQGSNALTSTTLVQQQSLENEMCERPLSIEMDINNPMIEEEENTNNVFDEDLPSFSDVEAMVLDMDLEPIGQDRYELEASRYRIEAMARKIMRFEQSSKSYMNRDIASHGAFAILYGSSKHYINKPEVLLGRDTEEYPVDINLGRLGSKTKISRRQALIRLKQDGNFEIKNLGKFSIWLNEKELVPKEVVTLKNNSLIQIREMSFNFELNENEVKKYLNRTHV
ncbi:unnamed protein product [Cochlearia groenlandica]